MAVAYGSMEQYASHCASAAAGTSSAPNCEILDTVFAAVSNFIFSILVRLLIVS